MTQLMAKCIYKCTRECYVGFSRETSAKNVDKKNKPDLVFLRITQEVLPIS